MSIPFCKKCLLAEIDPEGVYRSVIELVDALPEDKRCCSEEYGRRLGICRVCSQLSGGVCMQCGCYVELRAAKKSSVCPHPEHYWG